MRLPTLGSSSPSSSSFSFHFSVSSFSLQTLLLCGSVFRTLVDDGELGEIRGRVFDGAQHEQRAVVVGRDAGAAELIGGTQDCAGNIFNAGIGRQRSEQSGEPVKAEL